MAIGATSIGSYSRQTSSANIKSSFGGVSRIIVATTSSGTIQLYDSATTTTTIPITGVITPAAAQVMTFDLGFANGLYIAVTGTIDFTVVYN